METSFDKEAFEAAVRAEVEKRMEAQMAEIRRHMEAAMLSGLQSLDAVRSSLEESREALEREKDEVKRNEEAASREGEKRVEAYFEKFRQALVESTRKELLRQLTREHLERGKSVEDICDWLRVDKAFVEGIISIMDRGVDYRREVWKQGRIQLPHHPRLRYESQGRGGTIWFENDLSRFDMWWEFGGGAALVIIDIPTKEQWEKRTGLAPEQREDVLRFIAEQVIEDQTGSPHHYEIGDSVITILEGLKA